MTVVRKMEIPDGVVPSLVEQIVLKGAGESLSFSGKYRLTFPTNGLI